jgi:hypothetical protein
MDRSPAKNVEDNTILSNILNQNVELDDFDFHEFEEPIDPHADDVEAQRQARELSKDPHYVPSNEV